MTRKSQLDKFEARLAKKRMDEDVIHKSEISENKLEKRAGKIAAKHGISTEDIFAIIARDSIGSFIKMWNNSMESVIRETVRTEVAATMREVIQDEMAAAARGLIRGMSDIGSIMKQEIDNVMADEFESVATEAVVDTPIENNIDISYEAVPLSSKQNELDEAIINFLQIGDPAIGAKFKKHSSRNNGLYQAFMTKNKGIKGAWKNYVKNVIKNI